MRKLILISILFLSACFADGDIVNPKPCPTVIVYMSVEHPGRTMKVDSLDYTPDCRK